jgi:hypothetical protein
LDEFSVSPEQVGIRTTDTQLLMNDEGVMVHPRGSLRSDEALRLLRSAFRCASPLKYHFSLTYQFVIPIVGHSYDDARYLALDHMSFGPLGASDFAMLIDGQVADDEWHCEFGIVSEEEVEPRLRRWTGQMGQRSGTLPPFIDIPQEVAPVSFFADLVWLVPNRLGRGDDSVDDVVEKIDSLCGQSKKIVARLHRQVCEGPLQQVAGGAES